MHQPRPYGRFVHEAELSSEDAARVERLARSLTNFKHVSQLDSLKRVTTLSDGRQAVAVDMGGTFRVIILERHEDPKYQPDGLAEAHIPMIFSGVITKSRVLKDEGVGIKLTDQTRRRLSGYGESAMPPKYVALMRFNIDYSPQFTYFRTQETGLYTFTQYMKQRPTWYSGAMGEVMQVVGGFGRQSLEELPDNPIERARMILPERFMRRIRLDLANIRLPGYSGFPHKEGQFQCDYKWYKCHGVSFDSGNMPWLIQVDARGVFAMPLPIIPATATEAFREYVEEVGDTELEMLLDRFGGIPSGESFPVLPDEFEAWRRAGVIVKVCDTADFYEHQPYYQACGWSFNSQGTEGFNTCWSVDGANLKQGYAYKMRLNLAPAERRGLAPLTWEFADQHEADRVNAYLSKIYRAVERGSARSAAIKYKLRRHSVAQILARAGDGGGGADVDYWDRLEMEPIALHQGSVARVGQGPIYWGNPSPRSSSRLKFPELTGEGCESFDLYSHGYSGGPVRCDTIVFGCYVDDALQVVKYFVDDREFISETKGNFEQPMIVGRWEQTSTRGSSALMGNYYTSSFDDRDESAPIVTHTEIVGTDLGYGNPSYHTPYLFFRVGGVNRSRYYTHHTTTSTTEGRSLDIAVCVPLFDRDCIEYAFTESTTGRSETEEATRLSMADPNSYQLWCHDSIWHYMGFTQNFNRGSPPSKDGVPVYVDTHLYNPTEYSDYADGGNWLGLPPGSFLDVTDICGPYTSRSSGWYSATGVVIGGEAPGFDSYSVETRYPGEAGGKLCLSLGGAGSITVHKNMPNSWFFSISPDNLMYFYRDVARVTFGESRYASISETGQDGLRRRWGHTALATHKAAHHFIGVINE